MIFGKNACTSLSYKLAFYKCRGELNDPVENRARERSRRYLVSVAVFQSAETIARPIRRERKTSMRCYIFMHRIASRAYSSIHGGPFPPARSV